MYKYISNILYIIEIIQIDHASAIYKSNVNLQTHKWNSSECRKHMLHILERWKFQKPLNFHAL